MVYLWYVIYVYICLHLFTYFLYEVYSTNYDSDMILMVYSCSLPFYMVSDGLCCVSRSTVRLRKHSSWQKRGWQLGGFGRWKIYYGYINWVCLNFGTKMREYKITPTFHSLEFPWLISVGKNTHRIYYMVYLPTFTILTIKNQLNLGRYTSHWFHENLGLVTSHCCLEGLQMIGMILCWQKPFKLWQMKIGRCGEVHGMWAVGVSVLVFWEALKTWANKRWLKYGLFF